MVAFFFDLFVFGLVFVYLYILPISGSRPDVYQSVSNGVSSSV